METFKADNGVYFTRQLFWEEWILLTMEKRVRQPLFSLYRDKKGMINFGKAYIRSMDPTGYEVTQELLNGDYTLWTVLNNCKWFIAAKEVWDRELDAALMSEGMVEIRKLAKEGMPAQRLAAAKFLANREYRRDKSTQKGRPKKEDILKAAKELADNERDIEEDLKRITR